MNSREVSLSRQRPDRIQRNYNYSLPATEKEQIYDLLTTTIDSLDQHAIPDARIQNISHIQLIEPQHLRIPGDIAPPIHYMDIHNATFSNGHSKTEIVACGRVITLDTHPDKHLNDWSVLRPGEEAGKPITHLELLDFLQERIEDKDFNFISAELKTQPIQDDHVVNHLLQYFKGVTDRHDDTRYYNATSCSLEYNPVTNTEYFSEIDAALSVVDTKSSRTYFSHLSYSSADEGGIDGKSYDYKITDYIDESRTAKHEGHCGFNGQPGMSTTRINEVADTDFNFMAIGQAIRDTASLVKDSHFETSNDTLFRQELL